MIPENAFLKIRDIIMGEKTNWAEVRNKTLEYANHFYDDNKFKQEYECEPIASDSDRLKYQHGQILKLKKC